MQSSQKSQIDDNTLSTKLGEHTRVMTPLLRRSLTKPCTNNRVRPGRLGQRSGSGALIPVHSRISLLSFVAPKIKVNSRCKKGALVSCKESRLQDDRGARTPSGTPTNSQGPRICQQQVNTLLDLHFHFIGRLLYDA